MSNMGPSDDKFGTFWGVLVPPGPLLGCAFGQSKWILESNQLITFFRKECNENFMLILIKPHSRSFQKPSSPLLGLRNK